MDTIHDRIKARRLALDKSMTQLAGELKVTWQTVQQWETNPGHPSIPSTAPRRTRLEAVAKALGTTVHWLQTGKDESGQTTDPVESQVLQFYRGMSPDLQHVYAQQGNTFYNITQAATKPSAADPYPGKMPPKRQRKGKENAK